MILLNGCLFIHLPKTGGTTIRTVMAQDKKAVMFIRIRDTDAPRAMPNAYNPHALPREAKQAFGKVFAGLWKFTIVRNPWDRYVSLYHYKKVSMSFREFMDEVLPRNYTMTKYLRGCEFNYIGQQEKLQEAWNTIAPRLGLKPKPLPRLNATERSKPYWEYYNVRHRDMVAKQEAYVIEQFGYRFKP